MNIYAHDTLFCNNGHLFLCTIITHKTIFGLIDMRIVNVVYPKASYVCSVMLWRSILAIKDFFRKYNIVNAVEPSSQMLSFK